MNQHQQELRRAAAKAFIESLDQLHESLQTSDSSANQPQNNPSPSSNSNAPKFDLSSFEQAVADIEEFIGRQKDGSQE